MRRYAPPGRAWYALRRTLPPWSWERNLDELLRFCREARIDEVIVKVDTEEFSHGQVPLDWLREYLPVLEHIRNALAEIGVTYSLNPWITLGHTDRGRDSRKAFPDMQMMVGHDGAECKACACPLCETWRTHTTQLWRLYASTRPAVMWVEDDIRTFNHLPVRYGCFCPLHLKAFSDRIGRRVTREELVEALLAPGEPHPWRARWLELQGDIMVDVVANLAWVVQETSPETRMGLMSSGPDLHCLEGRRWWEFARALQGQADHLLSRPPLGIYSENSLRDFYYGGASIRKTRRALPPGAIELTEVENYPFSTFSKSVALTAMQMALSSALGCHGVTLNLFDHLGNPMVNSAEFGRMLHEEKDYLTALASRSSPEAKFAGIGILQHEGASVTKHLRPGADYGELADDGGAWAPLLEAMGFAVTWDWENAPVLALSGQTVRAFGDGEVERMLERGVLCDLQAAQALIDRGYGRYLGVKIAKRGLIHDLGPVAAEEFFDPEFGGEPQRYLSATLPSLSSDLEVGVLELAPGARALSRLVDCDRQVVAPLMTVFVNELGGRVAVLPYDLGGLWMMAGFVQPQRREQLHAVLKWLARGPLPLFVLAGGYALPTRAEEPGFSRVTVFNLSLDPWQDTRILLSANGRQCQRVEFLDESGQWVPVPAEQWSTTEDGCLCIVHPQPLTYRRPGAWCVFWKP